VARGILGAPAAYRFPASRPRRSRRATQRPLVDLGTLSIPEDSGAIPEHSRAISETQQSDLGNTAEVNVE